MFEGPGPRVFAQPPGADFPAALVAGLQARMAGRPPEAMAQVTLYLNTTRMRRAVRDVLAAHGAAFLPRLRLVTDPVAGPPAVSPLRRRLELSQLILRLLEAQPDLAPRTALYDLSDSLVRLMDEMQDEGVSPDALAGACGGLGGGPAAASGDCCRIDRVARDNRAADAGGRRTAAGRTGLAGI